MEKATKEQIGKKLKLERLSAKLTQDQLAKIAKVSRVNISCWENGKFIPNVIDCWRIADALKISIDELVGRK